MALFSVNQNGQWFTALAYDGNLDTIGDVKLNGDSAKKFWLEYKSTDKITKRSEVVNMNNHGYVKVIPAAVMAYAPKYLTVTYDTDVSATPINGEVYGIYLNQRNYHALGDRNFMELGAEIRFNSKFVFEAAPDFVATEAHTAGQIVSYTDGKNYKITADAVANTAWGSITKSELHTIGAETKVDSIEELMMALAQNFVRNLGADDELYNVTYTTTAIKIQEKEQDWLQGLMQNEHVSLDKQDMNLSTITVNTVDRDDWATIAEGTDTSNKINNCKDIADMEWFYLGEHGDQQRLMGYPYANRATIDGSIYKVKTDGTVLGYDLMIVHHAYVGNGTFVQKSEQDIMIAMPVTHPSDSDVHAMDGLLAQIGSYVTAMSDYDEIADFVDAGSNPVSKVFEF